LTDSVNYFITEIHVHYAHRGFCWFRTFSSRTLIFWSISLATPRSGPRWPRRMNTSSRGVLIRSTQHRTAFLSDQRRIARCSYHINPASRGVLIISTLHRAVWWLHNLFLFKWCSFKSCDILFVVIFFALFKILYIYIKGRHVIFYLNEFYLFFRFLNNIKVWFILNTFA